MASILRMDSMRYQAMLAWFVGSVCVSVFPVVATTVGGSTWSAALYNGQLLISAISILGSATASSVVLGPNRLADENTKVTIVLLGLISILGATWLYRDFALTDRSCLNSDLPRCELAHSATTAVVSSLVFLITAIAIGIAHVLLAAAVAESEAAAEEIDEQQPIDDGDGDGDVETEQ